MQTRHFKESSLEFIKILPAYPKRQITEIFSLFFPFKTLQCFRGHCPAALPAVPKDLSVHFFLRFLMEQHLQALHDPTGS